MFRLWRSATDFRHIPQVNRFAFVYTDDQVLHLVHGTEIDPRLYRHFEIIVYQVARRSGRVTLLQRISQVIHSQVISRQPAGIEQYLHHLLRASEGVYIPRPLDPLELRLEGMGHLVQFIATTLRVIRPQGQSNDRYIVDAFGFDNGLRHAESGRQPILFGIQGIV